MPSLKSLKNRATGVASRGVTALRSLPKAGRTFGTTLVREGREDLRDPNSSASRFARAPLGQYYLPGKVQSALRTVTPTPGGVARSYAQGVREGGLKGGARAGLTTFEVLSTPLLGSAALRTPKVAVGAGRAVSRGLASRGISLASEVGSVGGVRTRGAQAVAEAAMKAKLAKEAVPATKAAATARKPGEFLISKSSGRITINDVDFGELALGKAKVPGLTAEMVKSEGFQQAFAHVNRGKKLEMMFRAEVPQTVARTSKAATAEATMARAKATVQAAGQAAKARAAAPRPPLAQRLGTAGPKAAPKPKIPAPTKASEVVKRAASEAELTRIDEAAKVQQEVLSGARSITGKAAPKPKIAPKASVAPKAAPKTAPSAAAEVADEGPRGAIRAVLQTANPKRGAYSAIAKKYGISRQRIGQLVKKEAKKLAAGDTAAAPKPTISRGAKQVAAPAPSAVAPKASVPKPSVAPAAEEAVKVRVPRGTASGATSGASSIAKRVFNRLPKKTLAAGAVVATAANATMQLRGSPKPSTTTGSSDSWVNTLPPNLKSDIKGLMAVKEKYGESGLEALREGLKHAELQYGEDYFKPTEQKGPQGLSGAMKEEERKRRLRSAVRAQAKRLKLQ